jgi:hypothetical protein
MSDAMQFRRPSSSGAFLGVLLAAAISAGEEPAVKPLAIFVGDSITMATPSASPDYLPSRGAVHEDLHAGRFGYFEALVESTAAKESPLRLRKAGNRGQALAEALGRECRQILERRHRTVKELPAYLVVQDYSVIRKDDPEAAQKAAQWEKVVRELAQLAAQAKVTLILSTVATDPRGSSSLKAKDEHVQHTNELILKTAKELKLPVVRLDVAWDRYDRFARGKEPAKDWILTQRGKLADGVHPGPVGALFQALVFARELGIPAEQFDVTVEALAIPKMQAADIKKLVYSWREPTVIPLPAAKRDEK